MTCPESRGALRDVRRERLDADPQVRHELSHNGHRSEAAAPGVHEDLGVRAGRQDQRFASRLPHGGHRRGVVRVARVQQRDDDARVEDDYRHSRRSFRSDPFG